MEMLTRAGVWAQEATAPRDAAFLLFIQTGPLWAWGLTNRTKPKEKGLDPTAGCQNQPLWAVSSCQDSPLLLSQPPCGEARWRGWGSLRAWLLEA